MDSICAVVINKKKRGRHSGYFQVITAGRYMRHQMELAIKIKFKNLFQTLPAFNIDKEYVCDMDKIMGHTYILYI